MESSFESTMMVSTGVPEVLVLTPSRKARHFMS
jgi:hypothetical protein